LFLTVTKLLGGLGLFIYGMTVMSSELQKTAGHKLRALLYKLTTNRVSGLTIGSFLGFLIHSGATMVMVVGFTNAGLLSLHQSIAVMLGANVGTTLSMQVVAFNISQFAYVAIFLGLLGYLSFKAERVKHLSLVLFGFGLLFLGMDIMTEAVRPLKDMGYFETLLKYANATSAIGMLSGLLLSAVFTTVVQSSGATIGILFALSTAGVFTSLDQVFPLIIGAHIGTCTTALFGCIGTQVTAKRSAISHLVFNVAGGLLAIAMYKVYEYLIPLTSDDLSRQIANTHTLVQLVNALLFLPFSNRYADLIVRVTPSKSKEPEKTHLEDSLLITPEKAILAALLELQRMSGVAREMFQSTMRGFLELKPEIFYHVKRSEEALDALKDALGAYLLALAERNLSRRQSIIIQYLMSATSDLERIGDHVESIAELTNEKIRKNIWFEEDLVLDLIELYKKSDGILALIVKSFEPSFYDAPSDLAAQILQLRNEYVALSLKIKQTHNNRILEKRENPLNGIFYHRFIICFDKLVKHSKTIALVEKERFFFIKKHKLDKKSEKREPNEKIKHPTIAYDSKIFDE